jgi:hypothetical protein
MNDEPRGPRPLSTVKKKLLGRLAGFTGFMTAGVVTTSLGQGLGWGPALVWGLGAGAFAAAVFAAWFAYKETRPPRDE